MTKPPVPFFCLDNVGKNNTKTSNLQEKGEKWRNSLWVDDILMNATRLILICWQSKNPSHHQPTAKDSRWRGLPRLGLLCKYNKNILIIHKFRKKNRKKGKLCFSSISPSGMQTEPNQPSASATTSKTGNNAGVSVGKDNTKTLNLQEKEGKEI